MPGLKKRPSTSQVPDGLKLLVADEVEPAVLRADSASAALLKNEQDVPLFARPAFQARRRGG